MLTMIEGMRVGHATDPSGVTGCTVILCPPDTVASADFRGPAPGSREAALLAPDKPIEVIHAILLTGGSAFGLAAAEGVMRYLEELDIGHQTPLARIPLVPAAVVYDLFLGQGAGRPDAAMGYAACQSAALGPIPQGNVGAGAGVTVGKWAGLEGMMKGGFGVAGAGLPSQSGAVPIVAAAAVTNCIGDVLARDGSVLAGARSSEGGWLAEQDPLRRFPTYPSTPLGTNTTLMVVATNARLSKVQANRLAQRAHDGLAIAVRPAHTTHDGDAAFALATGQVEAPFDLVANAAVEAVADAIRNAVLHATTVQGIPGLAGEPK